MKHRNVLILMILTGFLGFSSSSPLPAQGLPFKRGDSTADGVVNLNDPVHTLNYLFAEGEEPSCEDAADANDDGALDVSDVVYGLRALFPGDGGPQVTSLECETDLTPDDSLTCEAYDACAGESLRGKKDKATPNLTPATDHTGLLEFSLSTSLVEELPAVQVEVLSIEVQSTYGKWELCSESGPVRFGDGAEGERLPAGERAVGPYWGIRLELADAVLFQGDLRQELSVPSPVEVELPFLVQGGKMTRVELTLDVARSLKFDPKSGWTFLPAIQATGAVFEPNGELVRFDREALTALKELFVNDDTVQIAPFCDESWFVACSGECLMRLTDCLMEFPPQNNCKWLREDGTLETNCCVVEYLQCMDSCDADCPPPGAQPLPDGSLLVDPAG